MKQVTLNVDDEFVALGDAVKGLIADIKDGKTALQDATDAFQTLVGAVTSFSNVAVDSKKVDNQVYLGKSILDAVEAVPAVPAQA